MILPPTPQPLTKEANPFARIALIRRRLLPWLVRASTSRAPRTPGALGRRFLPWLSRSIYATTGWLPGLASKTPAQRVKVLRRIGAGEFGAERELASARKALAEAKTPTHVRRAEAAVDRAKATLDWAKLTGGTMPGAVAAATKNPRAVLSAGWRSMGPVQKAMFTYFGGTGLHQALTTPASAYGQPGSEYQNRLHHLGTELGSALTWGLTAPVGLVPSIVGFEVGSRVGGLPGRLIGPQQGNPYVG